MQDIATMLWKELVQISNRPWLAVMKSFVALAVAGLFCIMALGMVYEDASDFTYSQMPDFSRTFFLSLTGMLGFLLSLGSMSTASTMVVSERIHGRLPLLLVTPLTSATIVISKTACTVTRAALVMVIVLPILVLLSTFGGFDWGMAVMGAAYVISNVWLFASIGILASTVGRTATSASLGALALAVIWLVVPPLLVAIVYASAGYLSSGPPFFLFVSPFTALAGLAGGNFGRGAVSAHVITNLAVGAGFLALAVKAFGSMAMKVVSGAPKGGQRKYAIIPRWRRKAPKTQSWISMLFQPGVIRKELASFKLVDRTHLSIIWLFLVWIGWLFSYAATDVDAFAMGAQSSVFVIESMGIMVALAIRASLGVVNEKEARTFQILAITGLGARRILAGKWIAAIVEQSVPLALVSLHLLLSIWVLSPFVAGETFHFMPAVMLTLSGFIGLGVSVAFSAGLGVFISLAAKKTPQAIVSALIAWFFGASIPTAFLFGFADEIGGVEYRAYICVIAALLGLSVAGAVCRRFPRRGIGVTLSVLFYGTVSAALCVLSATLFGVLEPDAFFATTFWFPGASLFSWVHEDPDMLLGYYLLPAQIGTILWMAAMSVRNFDAQARRAG